MPPGHVHPAVGPEDISPPTRPLTSDQETIITPTDLSFDVPRRRTTIPREKGPAAMKPTSKGMAELGDWREATLARMRALILEADPAMIEERKWKKPSNPAGVPTWSHDGIVCTGETYKDKVKLTFAHGASLPDPSSLFNASLEGNARRAIDIHEGESVDADAFKTLVAAAVARNAEKTRAGS
jgi:hypothetical protein